MKNKILQMVNEGLPKNVEVIRMTKHCTVTRYKHDNKIIDEVCRVISGNSFNDDSEINVAYHCYDYKKVITCNNHLDIKHLLYMLNLNNFYDKNIIKVEDKTWNN